MKIIKKKNKRSKHVFPTYQRIFILHQKKFENSPEIIWKSQQPQRNLKDLRKSMEFRNITCTSTNFRDFRKFAKRSKHIMFSEEHLGKNPKAKIHYHESFKGKTTHKRVSEHFP